ncbi:MAG TPA: hypothetical protein P5231_05845 [Ignavibacteriales bacterium]|nr:hypothetical protein [Ignavibacteriales bacterium]
MKDKLLLVDDNPVNLQLLVELLESEFEIYLTKESTEAFELAKKYTTRFNFIGYLYARKRWLPSIRRT